MKRKPKLLLYLFLLLLTFVLTSPAFASQKELSTENLDGTEVKVADVSASPNATVEVPVNIKNVVKLAGAMFELSYDPAVAVATAVKKGDFVGDFLLEANLKEADKGKIIVGMMGAKGVTGSGELCNITFKTGPKGKADLTIKALELNDEDGQEIPAKGITGSITIEEKPKLTRLELSGAPPACFKVGDTFDLKKLTLKGYDQYGKPYDLTNKPVKWASSNTGVAVIVAESILKAVGAGKTKVTATVEEVTSNPLEFKVSATFVIAGKKSGPPGGNTTVPISIKNAAGMAGAQFELRYDPKVAVATKAIPGDLVKDFQFIVNFNEAEKGEIAVALAGTKGVTGDGELCLLTFSLKGKVGDSTSLQIKDLLLSDEKGAEILACPEDGEIKISLICGDVNNDKRVTAADATLTLRAAVGLENLTYEQKCAANVNCDQRITAADVTLILRYAVGLDKELKCCCIDR